MKIKVDFAFQLTKYNWDAIEKWRKSNSKSIS